jgi:hypothetical protein
VAFSTLVACGASLPQRGAPPPETPTTVDEAMAQLDGAETQLDGLVPAVTMPPMVQGGAPPAQAQPTLPAPAPATATVPHEMAPESGAEDRDELQFSQDPCVTACRALSSMARAATHVCGLAGDGDARCTEARARVDRATQRVRSACPACSA